MRQPGFLGARANRREFIFNTLQLKDLFFDIVRRAKREYSLTIRNFRIMSNHIHFLIRPEEGESLSRTMQWMHEALPKDPRNDCVLSLIPWPQRYSRDKDQIWSGLFCPTGDNPQRSSETMVVNTITKAQLSSLVERAANGEEIIISKAGKAVAVLVPYTHASGTRRPGQY